MDKSTKSKISNQGTKTATKLTKQKVIRDNNTGFLFCPRCSAVVANENLRGICHHCGYRFCPSCID